jgi:hypothetical protein
LLLIIIVVTTRLLVDSTLTVRASGNGIVIGLRIVLFIFILLFRVIFIGFFEPMMSEYLRYGESLAGVQSYHPFNYGLCVFG